MKPYLFAALLIAGPALAEEGHDHDRGHDHDHDAPAHVFAIEGLEIVHPWANATDHDHALVYMELHNEGDAPVQIMGAHLESGLKGQLVGLRIKDGEIGFVSLPPIPVEPGKHLDLAPDGLAIHFDGLAHHLEEGHHWEVILVTSIGEVELDVAIEAEDARQHSHAGHDH